MTDYACRIAYGNAVFRNVFRYDAACTDYGTAANRYARKDDDAAAQPAAVADGDGKCIRTAEIFFTALMPVRSEAVFYLYGMSCRVQLHIGSN